MGWDKAHIQKNRVITVSYRKASRLPLGMLVGASNLPTMALTLLAMTWRVTAGQLGGTFGNRIRENMPSPKALDHLTTGGPRRAAWNLPRICERGLRAAKTDCPPHRGALTRRPVTVVVQLQEPFRLQGIEHASCEYLAGVSLVYERTIVTSTLNDCLEDLAAHVILCHQFVSVWSTPTSTGVDGRGT
jgi:hypothetical protein